MKSRSISRTKLPTKSPYVRAVSSHPRDLNRHERSTRSLTCANPCINSVIKRWSTFCHSRLKRIKDLLSRTIASSAHLKMLPARIRTQSLLARYTREVESPFRNHQCTLPCAWTSVATSSNRSFLERNMNLIRTSSAGTLTQYYLKSARANQLIEIRYRVTWHKTKASLSSIKV